MSEKLISEKWLREYLDDYDTKVLEPAVLQMLNNFHAALIEAPAVDAVEVVRCGDCRFYFHYAKTSVLIDGKNVKAGWCQRRIRNDEEYRMTLNDFCSYGERRMMYEASGSVENCREDGLRSQGAGLR